MSNAKLALQMDEMKCALQEIVSERQGYESDRSDRWHESERGQAYVSVTEAIEAAADTLEDAISQLEAS